MHPLINTWEISHRMNEFLLTGIKEEYFTDVSAAKGRSVGEQLAHIHNVRMMWLQASAPELSKGLEKIGKEQVITKKLLLAASEKSENGISELIKQGIEKGKVNNFKPQPEAFVGYLIE